MSNNQKHDDLMIAVFKERRHITSLLQCLEDWKYSLKVEEDEDLEQLINAFSTYEKHVDDWRCKYLKSNKKEEKKEVNKLFQTRRNILYRNVEDNENLIEKALNHSNQFNTNDILHQLENERNEVTKKLLL